VRTTRTATGTAAETPSTAARIRRRSVECLRCGAQRRVGAVEGECPSCGYLGWKPGHRRLALAPLHVR
jgi:ribosomal protein L37E